MSNQSTNSSVWSDLKYGFKTLFRKPPRMHRGVYWARNITFIFLGMMTSVVVKELLTCECDCKTNYSMNGTLEDSVTTSEVDLADESVYLSDLMVEASSSPSSTFEMNSRDPSI